MSSSASSSTRALKSSQDSSRFRNRSAGSGGVRDALSAGTGSSCRTQGVPARACRSCAARRRGPAAARRSAVGVDVADQARPVAGRAATAPPAAVRRRRAGAEPRVAARVPTAVSSVVPVPWASATKRARRGPRPRRSAAASSAGRSAGRSEESAATAGPRRRCRRRAPAPGSARGRARRRPCAAPSAADHLGGGRVVGDHDAPRRRRGRRARRRPCRPAAPAPGRRGAVAEPRRSAAAAGSWRRRAASPGRRPTSCARPHVSTSGGDPAPGTTPVRVTGASGSIMGRITRRGGRTVVADREGGPWPRRGPRTAPGGHAARAAARRSGARAAGCRYGMLAAIVVVYPVASLMFRLRYRHAERLPADRARCCWWPTTCRSSTRSPAPGWCSTAAGCRTSWPSSRSSRASPARCCAAPGRSRWPGSRPTRTPRSTRPRPTSTPATSS